MGLQDTASGIGYPAVMLRLLTVGAVANLTVLVALLHGNVRPGTKALMLLLDSLLTLGFIISAPGAQHQLLYLSLIPVTSAALRISRAAGLALLLALLAAYTAVAWQRAGLTGDSSLQEISRLSSEFVGNIPILALAGVAVAEIGARMKQSLIAERRNREAEARSALELAHQKSRLIFELASTLSATLNYERVLEAALDVSQAGLKEFYTQRPKTTQIGMMLLFGLDHTLSVAKSRGLTPTDENARFPAREGVLALAIERADPVVCEDPPADPELQRVVAMHGCQQAVVVPLRAGFESYGLLVLGSSEPDTYTNDFQDLLVAICNQAVMALQNARLYQTLTEEKDRLVTVEEDARRKLARDLHDGPTQTIAAIAMRLNYVRLLVNKDPDAASDELRQLEELARKTTREIRQMLFTLRPLILESQGLIAALEQLKNKLSENDPLQIHLDASYDVEASLSNEAKGSVFYIVEEATANVRKHAEATNVWIRLHRRGMTAIVEIEDDGKGFDVAGVEANYADRSSLGLLNLQERARLVGGKTVIRSAADQGTKVTVTIPISVEEAQSRSS